jgi:hypothetical protein
MLDLQRPVARLARLFRPTGGHRPARGSLGRKRGVGAASGGASGAAPTKRSQMSSRTITYPGTESTVLALV